VENLFLYFLSGHWQVIYLPEVDKIGLSALVFEETKIKKG